MAFLRRKVYTVTLLCVFITMATLLSEKKRIQMAEFEARALREAQNDAIGRQGHVFAEEDWKGELKPIAVVETKLTQNSLVDDSQAQTLSRRVRLGCFITTREVNMYTKMRAVKETWAKRCDVMVYVMTSNLTSPDILGVNIPDRHDTLTEKIRVAFTHMRRNHIHDVDWFLKADDDTYVIVENLKYLLSYFDPKQSVVIGDHFKSYSPTGYFGGGAGYVLSKAALLLLVDEGYSIPGRCRLEGGSEDIETARCLDKLGVSKYLSLDRFNRSTFHASKPETFVADMPSFVRGYRVHKHQQGLECCSQLTISFHYLTPETMATMELLLYRVSVFGRDLRYDKLKDMFAVRRSIIPPFMRRRVYPGEVIGDYSTDLTEWRKKNMTIYIRQKKKRRSHK